MPFRTRFSASELAQLITQMLGGGVSTCGTLGEKITQNHLAHRAESQASTFNVDHPASLTPPLMDMAVQKPFAGAGGNEGVVVKLRMT